VRPQPSETVLRGTPTEHRRAALTLTGIALNRDDKVCPTCQSEPIEPGMNTCQRCAWCADCGEDTAPGSGLCARCQALDADSNALELSMWRNR
jgi:hypothetical protein